MTYGEMRRLKNIESAEAHKNEYSIEEISRAELYKLFFGDGRGKTCLLSLEEMFCIADYVKENFPERS